MRRGDQQQFAGITVFTLRQAHFIVIQIEQGQCDRLAQREKAAKKRRAGGTGCEQARQAALRRQQPPGAGTPRHRVKLQTPGQHVVQVMRHRQAKTARDLAAGLIEHRHLRGNSPTRGALRQLRGDGAVAAAAAAARHRQHAHAGARQQAA